MKDNDRPVTITLSVAEWQEVLIALRGLAHDEYVRWRMAEQLYERITALLKQD